MQRAMAAESVFSRRHIAGGFLTLLSGSLAARAIAALSIILLARWIGPAAAVARMRAAAPRVAAFFWDVKVAQVLALYRAAGPDAEWGEDKQP